MDEATKQCFQAEPAQFLEKTIKSYVVNSPLNSLRDLDGGAIFEEPLVGFADGYDALFEDYKSIIADFHLTPHEVLTKYISETLGANVPELPTLSVISWVLPFDKEIKMSNRREVEGPSLKWNNARWHGQELNFKLAGHVVSLLEDLGHYAVAPESTLLFSMRFLPSGLASTWSQRHIAYAAGLGTFSLSDGFITPKGIAMRCGSVVTDLGVPPSPRSYPHHLANCLFYVDGSCRRCIERCPGDAISEKGHDKHKCFSILFEEQKPWLEGAHGAGYIGDYAGCGLCQTKVPCEGGIPPVSI
jgi:epoxyqueuosine reductase QueG